MITPLVSANGKKTGFAASEAVYDTKGRTLGRLAASLVVDENGDVIGEVNGNTLTMLKRPVPSHFLPQVALKWMTLRLRILREGVLSPNG